MRKVIYLMNLSLDGFVEGPDGKFGWSEPDEEVHRFHNQIARDLGAFLYGRRMYETMAGWETADQDRPCRTTPRSSRASGRKSPSSCSLRRSRK